MQDYVLIGTFTLPSQLAVAKSKLESEGIECVTKDELTVQSYNFLSNAIGGVKLLVHKTNASQARKILKEGGFLNEESSELTGIEKYLNNPDNLKKVKRASFVLLGILAGIVILVVTYTIMNRPTAIQKIANYNWCLDHMDFDNQEFYPYTIDDKVKITLLYHCNEFMNFNADGTLNIPGFETRKIASKWTYENSQITIFDSDTMDFVFNGTFDVELNNSQLILTSQKTSFYCYRD